MNKLPATPCSAFVLRQFPNPCKPRKRHHCIICGERIEIAEDCCRWSGLDPSKGYATCHAHPECYATTEKWDDMDWECHSEEGPRATPRMYWPNEKSPSTGETSEIQNKLAMGEIPETPAKEQGYGPLKAAACSASLVIDVLRGPNVAVGTRAIDSNIKSSKHGINWTKTRRHLESALQAAKQGNVVQVTILMQRTSLPNE
jgi:hypothetical protein